MLPILCETMIDNPWELSMWLPAAVLFGIAFIVFVFRKWLSGAILYVTLTRSRQHYPEDYVTIRNELSPPLRLFLPIAFLTAACHMAVFIPIPWHGLLIKMADTAVTAIAFWLLFKTSMVIGVIVLRGKRVKDQPIGVSAASLLVSMIRVGILFIGAFVILSYWVSNIAGLITGLGIGGLALTLAAQDTIGNFLASLVILFDQPFKVGDWITMNEAKGEVLAIGIRSTRLRAPEGALVSVPNKMLVESSVTNETERERRRTDQSLIIPWEVPWETVEAFKKALIEALNEHEDIVGTPLVALSELSGAGMTLYMSYYTGGDYRGMMATRDAVNAMITKLSHSFGFSFWIPERVLVQNEQQGLTVIPSVDGKPHKE